MKITRENLKNIVREAMVEESAYQEFFKKALEKAGKSIPEMSDEEKKAFFNKIDKSWNGKGEKKEIVETELEEAQSPAQKAAFAKMLAKKDGKDESTDDEKEEVKESVVNEDKVSNGTVSTLEKGIQRILGTEVNHDINRNGAHEFYIDDAEFVIGVNDGTEKKVAYSFSIYDDGARKYLGKGTAADEKDLIKQVLSIVKKYKKQLLLTTESVVNEEFKGNGNDFKYKFTMNLESHLQRTDKKHEIGKRDAYTSIKKITAKKDKRYEVRLSNHLSDKTFLEKVGKGIGAKLVDFKKGSTNIALYESVSEAAPKMKKSAESEKLQKVYRAAELSQKGGSPSRYSREFESAKKKALKYIGDMITYTKIGK